MIKLIQQLRSIFFSFFKKDGNILIAEQYIYKILVNSKSDRGLVRENNEDKIIFYTPDHNPDNLNILEKGMLFAIADGMGGHAAGEVASKMACDGILEYYNPKNNDSILNVLKNIFMDINTEILNKSFEINDLSGMGTTLSVLILLDKKVYIAHVGDSRIYLIRDNELKLLTKDHTEVQVMVDFGYLSPEEASLHPARNILTQAVGVDDKLDIFTTNYDANEGDIFLLTSDGLHDMIGNAEIKEAIIKNTNNINNACDTLFDAALDAGARDNISIIIFKIFTN